MNYLTSALREHQELAIFITLAMGFLIGRVKIGSFSLGTVVGTLLAGVAVESERKRTVVSSLSAL